MDLTATAALAVPPERVLAAVADLAGYPHWLGIVHRVDVDTEATDTDAGNATAWLVELGARLGPFKRTKRVRMVRTLLDGRRARFERAERDGRPHSPWVLSAHVEPAPAGTELTMSLYYGGSAWLPGLDLVLAQEMRRAGSRLEARLA